MTATELETERARRRAAEYALARARRDIAAIQGAGGDWETVAWNALDALGKSERARQAAPEAIA